MNIGIVLRSYFPKKNKILIYDRSFGKVYVSITNVKKDPRIVNGMIICSYEINAWSRSSMIKDFKIYDYPNRWHLDLSFLHNVLELYQNLVPDNAVCQELFELIYFLCSSFDQFQSINSKKIFLYKFFLILGLYPDDDNFYSHKLATYGIDNIANIQIDLVNEKKMCEWLSKCIKMYPAAQLLNTKNFLNELICYENV